MNHLSKSPSPYHPEFGFRSVPIPKALKTLLANDPDAAAVFGESAAFFPGLLYKRWRTSRMNCFFMMKFVYHCLRAMISQLQPTMKRRVSKLGAMTLEEIAGLPFGDPRLIPRAVHITTKLVNSGGELCVRNKSNRR
jgi:hypothetical protein